MTRRAGNKHERVDIDGVSFDNVTMEEAITVVEDHMDRGEGLLMVTANVDNLRLMGCDAEYRAVCDSAGLVLADGAPLLWLARLQGTPFKAKVSGSDFVVEFCRRAAADGRRVFFLGGLEGVAQRVAEVLTQRFPGLVVAGTHSPSFGFDQNEDENREIVERLRRERPDILFLAAGAPRQEKWLRRHQAELNPIVCLGVGAAFDFVSGRIRRAPQWMQNAGLEWLWRLAHEPRRLFYRYIIEDFPFFLRLVFKTLGRRLKGVDS